MQERREQTLPAQRHAVEDDSIRQRDDRNNEPRERDEQQREYVVISTQQRGAKEGDNKSSGEIGTGRNANARDRRSFESAFAFIVDFSQRGQTIQFFCFVHLPSVTA